MKSESKEYAVATLAGGCFWCTEAVFQQLVGVETVESGYMGGHTVNPSYKEVCTGQTGHAEVIHIRYDAEKLSFEQLLEVFFKTHDPTTLNRQGNDVGTQYRSAVFYHDQQQKLIAEGIIKDLDASGYYPDAIVTTLEPATEFYIAEDYHQNYFNEKGDENPYCSMVVRPKVEKFKKVFADRLK
ncbi:peptide-methionine (S)-S-oxide reductase MsrA [Jiulongibacter sp. NS-SX5]|uniref:peptide-methionine (S)-S-oxide reductase MsrA n=1 Tax=Jiulongibacter sp. NS-SX5 TaxID=3463854 RepID=UPI00405A24FF